MRTDVKIGIAVGVFVLLVVVVWVVASRGTAKKPIDPPAVTKNDDADKDKGTVVRATPTPLPTPEPTPVSALPTPTPTPPVMGDRGGVPETHKVASGETLSSIATKYYGAAKHHKLIADANPGINPNNLALNTVLKLPAKPADAAVRTPGLILPGTPGAVTPVPADAQTHKIESGDTLTSISEKHYGSARFIGVIKSANSITDENRLSLGKTLIIPKLTDTMRAGTSTPAPALGGSTRTPAAGTASATRTPPTDGGSPRPDFSSRRL